MLREHAAGGSDLEERARLAVAAEDFPIAAQLLAELEAHDPDRRLGPAGIPIAAMRKAMTHRLATATGSH